MRLALLFAAAVIIVAPALAAPTDIHVDVPKRAGQEVMVVEHDLSPGATTGWHIHHGVEISYVLSGATNVQIAGGPIRHVSAGESFEIERDTPHRATNDGTEQAALLITFLRDKAGPLAIPVPPPTVQ